MTSNTNNNSQTITFVSPDDDYSQVKMDELKQNEKMLRGKHSGRKSQKGCFGSSKSKSNE